MGKKTKDKNKYIQLFAILILAVFLTIFSCNIYKNVQENKLNNSYISKYVLNIQYNELKNAMVEFSSDLFLYISYTGSNEIYPLEVKLKRVLKDYELIDNMIYLNANELKEDENYINNLNNILENSDKKIKKLPAIVYFKDNKIIDVIDSEESLLSADNFVKLLEEYELIER